MQELSYAHALAQICAVFPHQLVVDLEEAAPALGTTPEAVRSRPGIFKNYRLPGFRWRFTREGLAALLVELWRQSGLEVDSSTAPAAPAPLPRRPGRPRKGGAA